MLKISFSHTLSQLQSSMASPCRIGDILLSLLFPSSTGRTANLLALAPLPKSFFAAFFFPLAFRAARVLKPFPFTLGPVVCNAPNGRYWVFPRDMGKPTQELFV